MTFRKDANATVDRKVSVYAIIVDENLHKNLLQNKHTRNGTVFRFVVCVIFKNASNNESQRGCFKC